MHLLVNKDFYSMYLY